MFFAGLFHTCSLRVLRIGTKKGSKTFSPLLQNNLADVVYPQRAYISALIRALVSLGGLYKAQKTVKQSL